MSQTKIVSLKACKHSPFQNVSIIFVLSDQIVIYVLVPRLSRVSSRGYGNISWKSVYVMVILLVFHMDTIIQVDT